MTIEIDQKLQTSKITPELIDYIVVKIVREIEPEEIILYGSYARGDFHKDSDLDLFIIKDGDETSRMMTRKVDALLTGRRFPLDVRVREPAEVEWNFRARNPFYLYHIFRHGRVLYESIGARKAREAIEVAEKIEAFVLQKLSTAEKEDKDTDDSAPAEA